MSNQPTNTDRPSFADVALQVLAALPKIQPHGDCPNCGKPLRRLPMGTIDHMTKAEGEACPSTA